MTGAPPQEAQARLAALLGAVRLRSILIVIALALPLALAATALLWCYGGPMPAIAVGAAALIASFVAAWRVAHWHDGVWLARRLNAELPALEDSADLVVAGSEGSISAHTRGNVQPDAAIAARQQTRLERLQRTRIEQRLASSPMPDLRPAWPRKALAAAWLGALLATALGLVAPGLLSRLPADEDAAPSASATSTAIRDVELAVKAPAYTGVATRHVASLDASVPAGSSVAWTIRFDREPATAALVFHDGGELPLRREDDAWRGERVLDASVLYRVVLTGAPPIALEQLHRIDAVPDHAPEITVRAPEKTLSLHASEQKTWDLAFEARDDYGLGAAELMLTLTHGSGEQIEVTEQRLTLDGGRDPHRRRYAQAIDLATLGYSEGDDLIARLTVTDNRRPEANVASSAGLILRWPPQRSDATAGMEGAVQRAMPAYFRSQRQLIIDTEALIGERASLDSQGFADRSDELGVDQRILRLRYGQFLGEELGGGATHPPEGAGAVDHADSAQDDGAANPSQPADHDDVPPERAPAGFGEESDVVAEFGHVHDEEEAATLFDPQTRDLLRAALDEMWQAELHLRQAEPDRALPYEYKALDYIKQVQQAERIYLERVGLELPQLDETRRLSGDRADLSDRGAPPPGADDEDSTIPRQWQALAAGAQPDLAGLERWAREHGDAIPDALGYVSAVDALRRDPTCIPCRNELAARLWPLLPAPAPRVAPRATPDTAGAAYLEAIAGERP